jgi:hypothetical protein
VYRDTRGLIPKRANFFPMDAPLVQTTVYSLWDDFLGENAFRVATA